MSMWQVVRGGLGWMPRPPLGYVPVRAVGPVDHQGFHVHVRESAMPAFFRLKLICGIVAGEDIESVGRVTGRAL